MDADMKGYYKQELMINMNYMLCMLRHTTPVLLVKNRQQISSSRHRMHFLILVNNELFLVYFVY